VEEAMESTSGAWEGIVDKKERRKMQNKLAQRAFRARTMKHQVDPAEATSELILVFQVEFGADGIQIGDDILLLVSETR
jgi:hypothetical protein